MATLLLLQSGLGAVWFLPYVAIFAIFYFLIIGPQRKRQRALQEMITNLKAGDRIITTGGIVATVKSVRANSLLVLSEKSMLEISRNAVAGMQGEEEVKE
ncbi:MAG TPA: preprotein translocase subunit YajC [Pyrinomonadaceae bacterium]|jgi:preprotein translocase subunit YajC